MLTEEVTEEDVAEVVARWTGIPVSPPDGGRGREADPHGGAPARARDRPGRGGRGGRQRAAPLARRALRPEPPDRQLPLPRPDRGRQDRARPGAGRVHVRLRAGDGADRHVRVHGEALGRAADRRAARIRGLRGGRPAHRDGPPPSLRGRAPRRDREGAPRRLQHAASDHGRRPAHRRAGPHGRLHQHDPDHDLERRLATGSPARWSTSRFARRSRRCSRRPSSPSS